MSDVNNSIDDFSSKNQVNNTPENSNYSNEDNNNSFKQQQDSSAYESSMNSDASISFDPKSSSPSSDSSNLHGQSSQYPQAQYSQSQYSQAQYPQAQYQNTQFNQSQYSQGQPQQSQYVQTQFNQQNAQFNQHAQPYAPQNYNQSSQAYNQFNQPQFAQAQAQFAQPHRQYPQAQYNQAQYPQSQYSQMQFNGQSSYKKPDYSHSMTYNQNSSQYGYRQNAETERLESYYSSTWNKREKILLAIICVVSIFLTYFSNRVLYVWFNIYTIHYYHILPQLFMVDFLWFSYSLLPFTLILSFAIVLRKKYSVILPSICSVVTSFLVEIFFRFIVEKDYNFEYYLKFIVYAILPIVIFVIALEVLQCKFMIRKRSNIVSSIILTFASSFIYVFVYFTSLTILFNSRYEVSDYMYGMISSVILLVVIPVLVALIMKLLGLPKFLNPQREEMNL